MYELPSWGEPLVRKFLLLQSNHADGIRVADCLVNTCGIDGSHPEKAFPDIPAEEIWLPGLRTRQTRSRLFGGRAVVV